MTEDEFLQAAKAHREELTNGRRARQTNANGGNTGTDANIDDSTFRTTVQTPGREEYDIDGSGVVVTQYDREAGNSDTSTGSGTKRVRSTARRSSNGSRSATERNDQVRSVASSGELNVYTEKEVVRLTPDKPEGKFSAEKGSAEKSARKEEGLGIGRVVKQAVSRAKRPKKVTAKVSRRFTDTQASEKQESLTSALESHFEALDEYLWRRLEEKGIGNDQRPIWSDADEEDLAAITGRLVKLGKKHEAAAVMVDGIIDSADYVTAFTFVAPRLKETGKILRATRTERKRRGRPPGREE